MGGDFGLGEWLVQPGLNSVSRSGTCIHVEPKAMEVLVCLARRAGETVPKNEILKSVWPGTFVTDDALIRSISELRRVFEDDAREPRIIQTIPKRGYRLLVAPLERAHGLPVGGTVALRSTATGIPSTRDYRWWNTRTLLLTFAALLLVALIAVFGKIRRWISSSSNAPSIHSIAVLPLQNLSGDATQEYFTDGMTDALITDLAQIRSLKVISRTSSMQYRQSNKSLPQIARELNVDGIIEGTVQRSADRVRITAQLIHGPSDMHLWAGSYERNLQDVFALERDISGDIAQQVQGSLTSWKPRGPRVVASAVLEAYVQGTYHLNERGRGAGDEERRQAGIYFQQAIDLDPDFAPAYVGLAHAHDQLSQGQPADLIIMRQAAQKAVVLDPLSASARVALGAAKSEVWDWPGAEQDYRRALALDPNSVDAHDGLGTICDLMGRMDEGWKEFQLAQELDPNQDHLADALYQRGQYDQAIEIRQRIALKDPQDGYNHYALALNYAQKSMFKEFTLEMGRATTLFGLPGIDSRLQHAYDQSRDQGVLRQWAKELEHLATAKQLYLPGALAQLYAALGEKDRAFFWLEEYRQHHDVATADATIFFKTDPWFAAVRSDPRFTNFLRSIGLPP